MLNNDTSLLTVEGDNSLHNKNREGGGLPPRLSLFYDAKSIKRAAFFGVSPKFMAQEPQSTSNQPMQRYSSDPHIYESSRQQLSPNDQKRYRGVKPRFFINKGAASPN